MELTKEHFDQVVKGLVTKQDADATEKRIVKRIDESQEELARMTSAGFVRSEQRFDKLEGKVDGLIKDLPKMVGEVMREVMREVLDERDRRR